LLGARRQLSWSLANVAPRESARLPMIRQNYLRGEVRDEKATHHQYGGGKRFVALLVFFWK
jgi:hypothetical protein